MGACPGPITNAFSRTVGTETGREVVGMNVGLVSKANDDEAKPRIARDPVEKMAGMDVNELMNKGRPN